MNKSLLQRSYIYKHMISTCFIASTFLKSPDCTGILFIHIHRGNMSVWMKLVAMCNVHIQNEFLTQYPHQSPFTHTCTPPRPLCVCLLFFSLSLSLSRSLPLSLSPCVCLSLSRCRCLSVSLSLSTLSLYDRVVLVY